MIAVSQNLAAVIAAPLTAPAARGFAIGVLVIASFGALWLAIGAYFARAGWPAWGAIIVGTILLCYGAFQRLAAVQLTPATTQGATHAVLPRSFLIVVVLEWVVIFGMRFILIRRRRPDLILPAIAAIVALHFFPLAVVFHYPLFHLTGALMLATTGAAFWFEPVARRQVVVCLGSGVVLWATAGAMLARLYASSTPGPLHP